MNKFQVIFATICSLLLLALSGYAQTSGGIRGVVYDKDFDAPLGLAEITVAETGQKVTATEEGNYVISGLEPGTYTLVVSKEGYTRKVFADVVVPAGSMTDQDASLNGEFTDMEEFVVQDLNMGGASEEGLLNLRMEAPALMDSVGADLMSQAGASDAASALKLVAGATVQDGKYAVVRGLPDRYVNSQMNRVRLPSADPDKRAVHLDQFPSALIESIQVSKTFTPDQQGDASGGAVNVVLKSIPDEPILKLKVGTEFNSNVMEANNNNSFLSYDGGGVGALGLESDSREIQWDKLGKSWDGAVGVTPGEAPVPYNWDITAGGKTALSSDVTVGGLVNCYYKLSSSSYDDGIDDDYWVYHGGNTMIPRFSGSLTSLELNNPLQTSLLDVQQSTEEVQWGGLGAVGVEGFGQSIGLLYMRTQTTEDTATLAEDTRGKEYFVTSAVPGYDPLAYDSSYYEIAPYQRFQTLDYLERSTETLQFNGKHDIALPEFGIPHVVRFLHPELGWTYAKSSSRLNEPDKRLFSTKWRAPYVLIPGVIELGGYEPNKVTEQSGLGFLYRIWKTVEEDSKQYFSDLKFPFEQWSGDKGYVKLGLFEDNVDRKFRQDSFSNSGSDADSAQFIADWDEYWSDVWSDEDHPINEEDIDVDYDGHQHISAWYYMVDVPLCSLFKVVGGVRQETTELDTKLDPESKVYWVPPGEAYASYLKEGEGDVSFEEIDSLPSLGVEFTPFEQLTVRASYNETVARQTFKELVPVQQQEYLGSDLFMGNKDLGMSHLKNYDIRVDLHPFDGSFISASWFRKDIEDPIEYVQKYAANIGVYTTAENYPSGELSGYEVEVRQELGPFLNSLEGLSIGANGTLIDASVAYSEDESTWLESLGVKSDTRDMLNTPEYLYNIFTTYDIEKTGTKLGLFYTVKGDALVAGIGRTGINDDDYSSSVYEKQYGTLNFSLSQKLGEHVTLSFGAKNLLNPKVQTVYRSEELDEEEVKTSYTKGITYSISLKGEF